MKKGIEIDRIRMTVPTKMVLKIFLGADSKAKFYGALLSAETGLSAGTLSHILRRLEYEGWLMGKLEDAKIAEQENRPRRRYYRMTSFGRKQAKEKGIGDGQG